MEDVGVTVFCLVYNHEKYIRACLDSIICQKTSFRYQIIVHDDASTDRSREIIEEYAKIYPGLIVPILQDENQWSKKIGIVKTFIEPRVHSKYVAICEGDDYWVDNKKLQKQFEAMEAHPECGICLHRTSEVSEKGNLTGIEYPEQVYPTGTITAEELFATFFPRFYQTTSYFLRASLWHEYIRNPPAYRAIIDIGDASMLLFFGSASGIYQINEVMSCYRRGAPTSWSAQQMNDSKKRSKHFDSMVRGYICFDEMTNKKYHSFFASYISKCLYAKCAFDRNFKDFFAENRFEYLKELPVVKRLTVYFGLVFPGFIHKIYLRHINSQNRTEQKKWYGKAMI